MLVVGARVARSRVDPDETVTAGDWQKAATQIGAGGSAMVIVIFGITAFSPGQPCCWRVYWVSVSHDWVTALG